MNVLHVPYCYYPDPVGGTEVYVASLARAQRARGLDVTIAAPGSQNASYTHDGVAIHRFGTSSSVDLEILYGGGDSEAAGNFSKILECTRPDVVHLHAFTSGVSVQLANAVREQGVPLVFTYHTPTVTCLRGTLMRWGKEVCDGEMQTSRCARCRLQSMGASMTASWILGGLPESCGALAGKAGLSGGFWTAFRATELVGRRHSAARRLLLSQADHIVAVCEWVRDVLLANGVPPEKITLSRQGLPYPVSAAEAGPREKLPVRFAFLGRLDAVKGVHLLIDAFALAPQLHATLDVFSVVQTADAGSVRARLIKKAENDSRIRFLQPMDATEVVERLRCYDALLVPSQWLESGPLVVYEAFAAGIPVVGSAVGGIAELVRDGENGILVPMGSAGAWERAITRLVEEPALLEKLKDSPKPIRTADDIAADTDQIYAKVTRR